MIWGASNFTLLKIQDCGVVYFSAIFLLILTGVAFSVDVGGVAWLLSVFAAAISIGLIFIQALVIRNWCFYCQIIHALVLAQALIGIGHEERSIGVNSGLLALLSFSLAFTILLVVNFIGSVQTRVKTLEIHLRGFTEDHAVFDAIINSEKITPANFLPEEIDLGNKEGKSQLVVVLSLRCDACKLLHERVLRWTSQFPDLRVVYRFFLDGDRSEEKQFVQYLLNLAGKGCVKEAADVIDMWYAGQFNASVSWEDHSSFQSVLDAQSRWFQRVRITEMPTLFFNSRRIPAGYTWDQLEGFLKKRHRC